MAIQGNALSWKRQENNYPNVADKCGQDEE